MNILHAFFSNTIVAFTILIGIVVFAHELGHFLAGKFFGIRVEEFSIGFGPKAFGFRKNQTEYRINWLPLGGYVRFFGADSSQEINPEDKKQSLLHAALYKRAIVSFAGPFANFVLSFLVMCLVQMHGLSDQPPVVGVLPHSIAEKSGFETGDRILSIDGKPVAGWSDLVKIIRVSANKTLSISLQKENQIKVIQITPAAEKTETIYGTDEWSGRIGITPFFSKPQINFRKGDFFDVLGIQPHAELDSINGIKIKYLHDIPPALEHLTGATSDATLAQKINTGKLNSNGLILSFKDKNEISVSFSSTKWKNWAKNSVHLSNQPWRKQLSSTEQTLLGQTPQSVMYPPILIKNDSILIAIQKAFDSVLKQASMIYTGIKMLISGHISLSNLGGPIAIAGVAGDAAKAGFLIFLLTLSLISINIGMINLLPLPALDGGTLFLCLIESIYGKPLPMRIQLIVQRVGIFFLLFLFVFVFYNDLMRLFHF